MTIPLREVPVTANTEVIVADPPYDQASLGRISYATLMAGTPDGTPVKPAPPSPATGDITLYGFNIQASLPITAALVVNYGTPAAVDPSSGPDLTSLLAMCTSLDLNETWPGTSLNVFNRATGSGYWDQGSHVTINAEKEYYPLAAECAAAGISPIVVNGDGTCDFIMQHIRAGLIQYRTDTSLTFESGRLDTSPTQFFYSEGGLLAVEVISKGPYGAPGNWPAPLWFLPADGSAPPEPDFWENFGSLTQGAKTMHYRDTSQSPEAYGYSNNHSVASVITTTGDLTVGWHSHLAIFDTRTTPHKWHLWFDRKFVGTIAPTTQYAPGFDREFYAIIDLATAGSVGNPLQANLPAVMQLGPIRIASRPDPAIPSATSGTQPEMSAIVAAMGSVSSGRQSAINQLIISMKNAGFFLPSYKPYHLWLMVGGDGNDAQRLVNIMSPGSHGLVAHGSPVLSATGIGGASGAYYSTDIALSTFDPQNLGAGGFVVSGAPINQGGFLSTALGKSGDNLFVTAEGGGFGANIGFPFFLADSPLDGNTGFYHVGTRYTTGAEFVSVHTVGRGSLLTGRPPGHSTITSFTGSNTIRVLTGLETMAAVWITPPWSTQRMRKFRTMMRTFMTACGVP